MLSQTERTTDCHNIELQPDGIICWRNANVKTQYY